MRGIIPGRGGPRGERERDVGGVGGAVGAPLEVGGSDCPTGSFPNGPSSSFELEGDEAKVPDGGSRSTLSFFLEFSTLPRRSATSARISAILHILRVLSILSAMSPESVS